MLCDAYARCANFFFSSLYAIQPCGFYLYKYISIKIEFCQRNKSTIRRFISNFLHARSRRPACPFSVSSCRDVARVRYHGTIFSRSMKNFVFCSTAERDSLVKCVSLLLSFFLFFFSYNTVRSISHLRKSSEKRKQK